MSVPVRYSAAAEYAVVDSGLDNTLTQEEQYHRQQQQQYQHQQQHQQQQLEQQQQYEQYQQQQYEQEQQEQVRLYCQLQQQLELEEQVQAEAVRQQQQQLMQQRSSMLMSSSGMPGLDLPNNNNTNIINVASNINNNNNNMDAISINAILVDDEQPSTSAQAAAAAALIGGKSMASNGIGDHNTEMPTDWMRIVDEGRYGTPGAAGLEYQKYEQQQTLQQTLETEAESVVPAAIKKLEEQLNAFSSDELYETLKEYDALQDKYHTVLLLPKESRVSLKFI